MRCRYSVAVSIAHALWVLGCGERSEIIARERTLATGGNEGAGGSAGSGGAQGLERPHFAVAMAVDELNDPEAKDQDPTLTEDELEVFFFSDRGGNADIWTATRTSREEMWGKPVSVPELNSEDFEQNPSISRDGLRLWFYSRRAPAGIYFAERSSRSEAFGLPEPLPIEASDADGFAIAPSVDVTELRMSVSIGAGVSRDLYELVRASRTGSWGQPELLIGVNGDHVDSTPYLIDEGRELLFHSGRSGSGDLFWAYRESLDVPFTQVEPLSEVNDSVGFESHPHLTMDRRRLYFGSDREGSADIFVAEALDD